MYNIKKNLTNSSFPRLLAVPHVRWCNMQLSRGWQNSVLPTGATINWLLYYQCFKDPSKCSCFEEKMHLLVELLFPLLFTLTRVFLAVWTNLPILSPSILCKEISDNTQQWTNPIYPGSEEAEWKKWWAKASSQKTFSIFLPSIF